MSLQLWLPMTKDFSNQGLQNSTITNNSATLDNNGKLGKCGYFSGSTYLKGTIDCADWVDYSLACWIKPPAASAGNKQVMAIGKSSGWTNCRATIVYVQNSTDVIAGFSDGTNSIYYGMRITLTANAWNHVVVTYSNKTLKFYLNGVYQKSYTTTFDPKFSDITNFGVAGASDGAEKFTGYLNDVRIYNNALSDREIEILSRGLVCHYPLNNNGGGQPNLYDFESVASKWAEDGLTRSNYTDDVYGNVLKVSSSSTQSSNFRIYREVSNVWNSGQTYTVSFLAKASKSATVRVSRSVADYASNFTVGTTWKRYSGQINCTTTATGGTLSIQLATLSTDLYITQVKLELGDKVTAYQPGVGDSHYIPLGYDSTTEYDVSGYGYNGTKNGTIAYLTDTPRYNVSTNIKGASSYIQIPNLTTTGFSNSYSFAWWGKVPSYQGYMMWGFSDGQRLNGIFNGNLWNTGDGANNPLYIPGTTTQVTVPTVKVWHHWVMTGDGTTCKVYQDGVLWATAKTYKPISGTTIYMNGWDAGTSYTYGDYQMSDFRIYATALSATQVAELYNTAVSVANNGTLMGYELVEV